MNDQNKSSNKGNDPSQWVDLHGSYLYHYALSRLRNPDLAENAVQETFLAGLESRPSFAGKSSERTWLIGILKHKIVDHYRKNKREISASEINDDQEALDSFFEENDKPKKFPSGWIPDARELAGQNEFWLVLDECLKKLPQHTADAFTLREIDEMDTESICKLLGISSTNLWVMLHRARLQLRACLEKNWFENK